MKDVITSREDIFLAKIAGIDADIRTMTPPVASNTTERLMLMIADRIDKIESGSADTYTTVSEIKIGTMVDGGKDIPNCYFYRIDSSEAPDISDLDATYRILIGEFESDAEAAFDESSDSTYIGFNVTLNEQTGQPEPVEPDELMLVCAWGDGDLFVISNRDTLPDDTITIQKKVPGGSMNVDSTLDADSANPVQNKAIYAEINNKVGMTEVSAAIAAAIGDAIGGGY